MPRTRIKICGVRSLEIANSAAEAGADAIGLIRVAGSPRFVDAEAALRIVESLPPWVTPVAVFADATPDEILGTWPHDWIQLHGRELDVDRNLSGRAVIKAVSAALTDDAILWWDAHPLVRALLVDAPTPGGGTTFDLRRLESLRPRLGKPLVLAGGLHAGNVAEAIQVVRPWAVDVSSGVEQERGIKSAERIREFCAAVRRADLG